MFARLTVAALGVTAVAVMTTSTGRAQSDGFPQGGPRDWSHTRLVGSSFGRDGDRNIDSNWRTHFKRVRLERMLERRGLQDQLDILDLLRRGGRPKPRPVDESEPHLDWSMRTGSTGNVVGSPGKFSFDITTPSCSDVVYYTGDYAGSASAPNVIALTNIYGFCGGQVPTVKWGVRMTAGTATSAVPSLDGKVLYVLENSSPVKLHAINVDNITTSVGSYNFSTNVWSNAHTLSTASFGTGSEQLFQITFPAGVTNNVSSPWLDYTGNQIFFGDSAGRIQHVTNVHLASAARDTTNFANACGANQLTSPVFIYGQVIVTSYNGFLYRLDTNGTAPYTCIASAQFGGGTVNGIAGSLSGPMVDVGNDQIIVNTNNGNAYTGAAILAVPVMFASGASYSSAQAMGPETTQAPVTGTFDDAYWSTGTGNYYIVAANAANTNTYVYRYPYNGSLGAAAGFVQLNRSGASAVVATSPVSEFLSTGTPNKDEIYVGGGGGTYLFMNRVLAGFGGTDATPATMANSFQSTSNGGTAVGITSPIVIDNNAALTTGGTATANIYYGTLGITASSTQSTIVQLAQQF